MDLVTGATGTLGKRVTQKLTAQGRTFRVLARPGTDLRRLPPDAADVIWGTLDDPEALARATHGIDTIFHIAARVARGGNRAVFERDNVLATETLLEAAEAGAVRRLVYVSSAGIYGSGAGTVTEATELDPRIEERGAYAWSKAEADRLVRDFAAHSRLEVIVIRPALLVGQGTPPFFARMHFPIPRSGGRRLVVARKAQLLPLTHVDSAAEAIVKAATQGTPGAAYNVIDVLLPQDSWLNALREAKRLPFRPVYVSPIVFKPVAAACDLVSKLIGRSLPLTRYKLKRATESLRYTTAAAEEDLSWQPRSDLPTQVADEAV